jgi:hypothetical protein
MDTWETPIKKFLLLLIATALPLSLHAQTITPEKWGVTASCLYEAAVLSETPETYCASSGTKIEEIEIIREREGYRLAQPTYRFTRIADTDSEETSDLPEQISIDIPLFEKLQDGKYFAPLEIMVNTGGTGWFSSISFAVFSPAQKMIEPVYTEGAGDRCNDGYAEFVSKSFEDGGVIFRFRTAMTPFRLLNPTDETDWRRLRLVQRLQDLSENSDGKKFPIPKTLNGWFPYDDVANSAVSCIGWVNKEVNLKREKRSITGVSISPAEIKGFVPQTTAEKCSIEIISGALNFEENEARLQTFAIEKWQEVLSRIEASCAPKRLAE